MVKIVKTAGGIASTIRSVTTSETHNGIDNLFTECQNMRGTLVQLEHLANDHSRIAQTGLEILRHAQKVISDTQSTQEELRLRIEKLRPSDRRLGKLRAFHIRAQYLMNEKSIQDVLLRLQARQSALALVVNMSTN